MGVLTGKNQEIEVHLVGWCLYLLSKCSVLAADLSSQESFPPVVPGSGLALPLDFGISQCHNPPVLCVLECQCHRRALGQAGGATLRRACLEIVKGGMGRCWGSPWAASPASTGAQMCLLQLGGTIFQPVQRQSSNLGPSERAVGEAHCVLMSDTTVLLSSLSARLEVIFTFQ